VALIDLFGYVGAAVAIGCYLLMNAKRISLKAFNWSEFLAAIPLAGSTAVHGAWPSFIITVSYGAIGFYGVVTGRDG